MELLNGQVRQSIFSVQSYALTGSAGATLAAQDAKFYRRFTGMISLIGSATFRYRMGPSSGNFIVSSTMIVNSGVAVVDVLNLGRYVDFALTAACSQQNITASMIGDSQR